MSNRDKRPNDDVLLESGGQDLRRRAEEIARSLEMQEMESLSPEETRHALHELQVHQIELEIQNEELRRAQMELETSRAQYFDLYDLAPVAYLTLDEKGLILEANLAAATLLGLSRVALVKQLLTRFILEEDQDIYYLHRKQLLETGAPQVCQFRMLRANTDPFWAYLESTAALDAAGVLVFRFIISDINDRQRAEESMRYNLAIIEEATDAIITTKNDEGFTITNWNSGAEKLYGWKKEEVLDRSSMFLQNEYPGQDPREVLEKILETGLFEGEVIQSRKDGTRVSVEARLIARKDNKGETTDWICINRDTANRNRAEEALQESEALQRILLNNLPAGVIIVDPVTRVIERVNDHVASLFGAPVSHLVGQRCHSLLCPASEGACPVLDLGQDVDNSDRVMLRMDGSRLPILKTVKRVQLNGQEKLLECFLDMSERKQAEKILRESENKYRLLIETMLDGVYRSSHEGRFLEVNPAMVKMLGYDSKEELQAIDIKSQLYFAPEDRESLALDKTHEEMSAFRLRKKDGSQIWVEAHGRQVFDDEGAITYHEGVLREITERRQAEEALRESEERYHQLFESASDALFLSATDTGLIVEANTVASELYGYDRDELLTKKSTDLSAEPEETEQRIHEAQTTPDQVISIPLRLHRKKDGTVFPVEITARFLFVKGRRLLLAAARDITDRKQLEERIRQVRSDLLFAVSHDLKSPLQALHQSQEMLSALQPGDGLARFQEYSEIWRRNLQRLERMINNLLDSQRTEEGRFPLLLAPCDPVELVKQVAEDLAGYALSSAVSFDLKLQPVPHGSCDEEALSRVVENLLTNAVKFSPKGGKVEIRLLLEDQTLLLEVKDHGLGIPALEQTQLFQPFQRGSSAERKGIPGTGLGLYVCRRIVEEHGGTISLTSEEGKGTEVVVRLPWKAMGT